MARAKKDKAVPAPPKAKSAVREYVEAIALALSLALLLRFFVVEAFKIPSGSMIETLNIGDFIFVNKLSYRTEIPYSLLGVRIPFGGTTLHTWREPKRGDVMVFRFPADPTVDYIKRIVGLPGDTIELKHNELYVNGHRYERKLQRTLTYEDKSCREERARVYLEDDGTRQYEVLLRDGPDAFETFGPVTVKPGHVFVMGDNRDNSSDSRAWGQAPITNIKGKALFVWLSLDPCGGLLDRVRWSRFGKVVR